MKRRRWFLGLAGLGCLALAVHSVPRLWNPLPVQASTVPGTGTLSGMVEAPQPFQAAQVYARNLDKNILYMVYTNGGRYQAVNLFPGNYDVTVQKRGFAADTKKLAVKAGENSTANFRMREADPEFVQRNMYVGSETMQENLQLVPYDTLYPPGAGRDALLNHCIYCHGQNFFPSKQWSAAQWNAGIDLMLNPNAPAGRGARIPAGTVSQKDRETLVAYLAENFGPHSPKRALKIDVEFPLDEQVLSRAMYVEYYLPLDPKLDAQNRQRQGQDPHFDKDGNVWYTDRSVPNRIGKLDPRTGTIKDYVAPNPKGGLHGLTVDSQGHVWFNETTGMHLGRLDPKTGEFMRYAVDPKGEIGKNLRAEGHTPILDSKQNVWFTVIVGNKLGKWDRKTGKLSLWEPPTPDSFPYGIVIDKMDTIWFIESRRCKVTQFDPRTEKFTEYLPLTRPCRLRRLGIDSQGTIWYGVFSHGKLGKLDPKTGKIVEYDLPMPFSEPYDTWPDREDNIWIGDGGQGGALIRFDPRQETFTYYPSPQRTDMPKLEITREGAIWYNPRSSENAAVGVLYPDVSKMTTLAAYY